MTEPPTVYVVCKAEYEDNGPVVPFTTRELAEQHAAHLRDVSGDGYEVLPMPLLDRAPVAAQMYSHAGSVRHGSGEIEGEKASAFETWEYYVPAQPVVGTGRGPIGTTHVHVSAASPEAAEAAFRDAVNGMRATG
jgi:hypothetical protein